MMNYVDLFTSSFEKRKKLNTPLHNCFRLFNADGDGIEGVAVDFYDGYFLVQIFEENLLTDTALINSVVRAVENSGFKTVGILVKDRTKLSNGDTIQEKYKSRLIEGTLPEETMVVLHDGIKVKVDLIESQNTGLFMDMRTVRRRIAGYYQENFSILNLFSYTCVFGVHAVLNGVTRAVNVDIAKPVLKRGMDNYLLNGLKTDDRDFIRGDSLEWVKKYAKKNETFNFVIFDPPTFARSKKSSFSVTRDYSRYLEHINGLVRDNGYVLSAANTYNLSLDQYREYHPENWDNVFVEHESDDFPFKKEPYLKVGLWKVKK